MALSLTGFNLILSHQRQARYTQVFLRHMHFPDDPIAGGRVFDTTPPALKAVRLDHLLTLWQFPYNRCDFRESYQTTDKRRLIDCCHDCVVNVIKQ